MNYSLGLRFTTWSPYSVFLLLLIALFKRPFLLFKFYDQQKPKFPIFQMGKYGSVNGTYHICFLSNMATLKHRMLVVHIGESRQNTNLYSINSRLVNMEKYISEERAFIAEKFLKYQPYVGTILAYPRQFQISSHKEVLTRKLTIIGWQVFKFLRVYIKKRKGNKELYKLPNMFKRWKKLFIKVWLV